MLLMPAPESPDALSKSRVARIILALVGLSAFAMRACYIDWSRCQLAFCEIDPGLGAVWWRVMEPTIRAAGRLPMVRQYCGARRPNARNTSWTGSASRKLRRNPGVVSLLARASIV